MRAFHLALAMAAVTVGTLALGDQPLLRLSVTGVTANGCSILTPGFSPNAGASRLVLEAIQGARQSIRMAAYSFTEPAYARALLEAKRRGVDVAVVVDSEHNGRRKPGTPSVVDYLRKHGVRVAVTSAYAIQHNKFVVVDGSTVQTGSMNYSRAGDRSNAENVLVIASCPSLAGSYLEHWQTLWNGAGDKPQ